ncbi:MAG: oligosaccharide flippase family protein [Clostridia bacterium]|nr:oligosaccharide flippase family protein [Clostridia bacterium]
MKNKKETNKGNNKLKLFVENMLVYGFGSIISKLVPLIMIFVVTNIIPDRGDFGKSDMVNTVVSLASALAVMGMYDAMYRLFFEKKDEDFQKKICSTTLFFTMFSSLVVTLLVVVLKKPICKYFYTDTQADYLVYLAALSTLVGATNTIISAPTRMQNKRKVFLVTNTVAPILSYSISIPLLLKGYYVIAMPIAALIASLVIEISFAVMNRKWFSFKKVDKSLLKPLLAIAVPLIPNFLIYWVFNSSDKVMISNILGQDYQAVYSACSKLGHVSQIIYTAFAGGWQFFAFSTMKEKNQVKNNSLVFEYLGAISYVATAFVCVFAPVVFLLMRNDYYEGYISSTYLFLAPLLQMLFQVACNQFIVVKKTWPNAFILSIGAIVNVILNAVLIPIIGIEGAAIATLVGYTISDIIVVIVLKKMKLMVVTPRLVISSGLMAVYFLCWRLLFIGKLVIGMICAVAFMCIIVYLYRSEMNYLLQLIGNRNKKENEQADNAKVCSDS